jgi:hypothetical protein
MRQTNEKAWMRHRGRWVEIANPLFGIDSPDADDRRQSLIGEYRRKWWTVGPTFLYPDYYGILIYTYAYVGKRNLPAYMIWIHAMGLNMALYAREFPDLLDVLNSFTSLVLIGLFVDLYRRGQEKET